MVVFQFLNDIYGRCFSGHCACMPPQSKHKKEKRSVFGLDEVDKYELLVSTRLGDAADTTWRTISLPQFGPSSLEMATTVRTNYPQDHLQRVSFQSTFNSLATVLSVQVRQ